MEGQKGEPQSGEMQLQKIDLPLKKIRYYK